MLAKLTSKNQITLPKAGGGEGAGGRVLRGRGRGRADRAYPVRVQRADAVRDKLAALGIRESDVADAVEWARGRR